MARRLESYPLRCVDIIEYRGTFLLHLCEEVAMASHVIVEATEADLPFVVELLSELSSSLDKKHDLDQQQLIANCLSIIHNPHAFILLAKDGDETIGLISTSTRRTALHPGPSALIDEIIVRAKHQGRGIGSGLLTSVIDRCRQLGCCEIEVSTEISNAEARAFYLASGFSGDTILFEMDL
jgi:GNAT superfamily N-acetyltransferase